MSEERNCGGCVYLYRGGYDWYYGGYDPPECNHPDAKVRTFQYLLSFPFKNGCPYKKLAQREVEE